MDDEGNPQVEDQLEDSPEERGEQSLGATNTELEEDDDALKAAQKAGLQQGESEEKPKEVDLGRDINEAEASKVPTDVEPEEK